MEGLNREGGAVSPLLRYGFGTGDLRSAEKNEKYLKNQLTKRGTLRIITLALFPVRGKLGGIAQLARACGSYPQCPRFKSRCRYQNRYGPADAPYLHGALVKRLRHRPFTAVTRVRFPYASPLYTGQYGGVAQPVEHLLHTQGVTDSSSVVSTKIEKSESVCRGQRVRVFRFPA